MVYNNPEFELIYKWGIGEVYLCRKNNQVQYNIKVKMQ